MIEGDILIFRVGTFFHSSDKNPWHQRFGINITFKAIAYFKKPVKCTACFTNSYHMKTFAIMNGRIVLLYFQSPDTSINKSIVYTVFEDFTNFKCLVIDF